MKNMSDVYAHANLPTPTYQEIFIHESTKDNHLDINVGDGKMYIIHLGNDLKRETLNKRAPCDFDCVKNKRLLKGVVKANPQRIIDYTSKLESFSASIEERCRDVECLFDNAFFLIKIKNFDDLIGKCIFYDNQPFKCLSRKLSSSKCYGDFFKPLPIHNDQSILEYLGRIINDIRNGAHGAQ